MKRRVRRLLGASLALLLPCAAIGAPDGNPPNAMQAMDREVTDLAAKASVSVVSVTASQTVTPLNREPKAAGPAGPAPRPVSLSRVGSGFIASPDGIVLTSADVLRGAERVSVRFADGRVRQARVLGSDDVSGIAVLKVDADSLVPLRTGGEAALPGALAVLIGNFRGQVNTVWVGNVGRREVLLAAAAAPQVPLLQIHAPAEGGASGAPVLNSRGEVIGVVVASAAPVKAPAPEPPPARAKSEVPKRLGPIQPPTRPAAPVIRFWAGRSPEAVGGVYAAPIHEVLAAAEKIRTAGKIERAYVGVVCISTRSAEWSAGKADDEPAARVVAVYPESPAAQAGVQVGDVVLAAGEKRIRSAQDLVRWTNAAPVGGKFDLRLWREQRSQVAPIVTARRPAVPATDPVRFLDPTSQAGLPRPDSRLTVAANGKGLEAAVTMRAGQAALADVLQSLIRNSGLTPELPEEFGRLAMVDLAVANKPLRSVLNALAALNDFRWEVRGEAVVIRPNP